MTEHQQKYHEYLQSPEWKEFRNKAFEHYGKKCAHCKRTKRLQIHHVTYANIFNEKLEDVMVLCDLHHKKIHGLIKRVPTTKKKKHKKIPKHVKFGFKPSKGKRKKNTQMKKVRGNHAIKTSFPNLDLILENKRRREQIRG
jgi:phage terminase large subunit GpA-like protein